MLSFAIRNATPDDLDAIMEVESHWPEDQRAKSDQFQSRIERFPAGVFLAETGGQTVAVSTSMPTRYDPADISDFASWDQCTNNGYLHVFRRLNGFNALLIVSNGIVTEYRRQGIREAMISAHITLAGSLGLRYTVTGAMMPGYDAYCRRHGERDIANYATAYEGDFPIDPTLRKLATLGLVLPDKRHLIADYYPSPASRNYGALLVHDNASAESHSWPLSSR